MRRFKNLFNEAGMADDSRIKSLMDKIEYLEKRKANSSGVLDRYREQMNNTNNSDEADRIQKNIDRARDGMNKHNEELKRVREILAQAKEAYKSRTQNEAIEADDISVGKKKKVPAGIKVDPNLKGYAYNEKRVTDIDVEQGERDLKLAKLKKAKQKVQNEDEFKPHMMYDPKTGKGYKAEVEADHERMSKLGYTHEKPKANEHNSMDILLTMLEETNLDEALSPKEKEKRLQMIKKAVEKLNRANLEKVKRMAMRDMKASGMFDDAMDEHVKGGADSYAALQNAKAKVSKTGKAWDSLGQDEKDRILDKEMVALGYEKKPGNTMYTKVPTGDQQARIDKEKADDNAVDKMSEPDQIAYYKNNPSASTGGRKISDKGLIQIQIDRHKATVEKYEKAAMDAYEKMQQAEEDGDDLKAEKFQDEEQAYQDKAATFERKIDELEDKLSDME